MNQERQNAVNTFNWFKHRFQEMGFNLFSDGHPLKDRPQMYEMIFTHPELGDDTRIRICVENEICWVSIQYSIAGTPVSYELSGDKYSFHQQTFLEMLLGRITYDLHWFHTHL